MKVEFDIPYGLETWVPLNYNGTILQRYSVSDYGRIYDHKRSIFIPYNHQRGLYWYANIHVNHSVNVSYAVHRAVLLSFKPIENFKSLQVNHINGNVQDNSLTNLEWVTPAQNTWHSIETGLRNQTGMNNGRAKYSDEDIHKICKMIDEGYTNSDIASEFGYSVKYNKDERNTFMSNLRLIRNGKSRRDISSQYNFMSGNIFRNYSTDFAHLVCNFLSDPSRNYTYDEIANYLLIPAEERLCFKQYINKLILGKTAKEVTELYDLKRPIDYYDDTRKGYKNRKY